MSAFEQTVPAGAAMPGLLDRERIIATAGFNRWLVPPAALYIRPCPRDVRFTPESGHWDYAAKCLLCPQKRTFAKVSVMSALCQKRTSAHVRSMSALPPKADIAGHDEDVRFVPCVDGSGLARRIFA